MKVIFTRASKKPNEGVTVTAVRVMEAFLPGERLVSALPEGFYILHVKKPRAKKTEQVVFWTSRGGKTLYTSVWPKNYPLPQVGAPIELELVDIDGTFTAEEIGIGE